MNDLMYTEFRYWADRRVRTSTCMARWLSDWRQSLDDAGYCLDRPEPL